MKALLLLLLAAPAGAVKIERLPLAHPQAGGPTSIEVVAEQAMVRFSTTTPPPGGKAAALAAAGARVLQELPTVGWTVVELPAGMSVASGLAALRGLPGVAAVEPNHVYHANRLPNDPNVPQQYGLSAINAPAAWEFERGQTRQVTVAVIDAGVDGSHSELQPKLIGTSQFFDPNSGGAQSANNPPTPACNHATRVAGIAAARTDNGTGVAGISWGARLISLKVFADGDCNPLGDCPGGCTTTDPALVNAVNYATSQQGAIGPIVINMSIGGAGACPGAVKTALDAAVAAGIPVVISAGNDGSAVNTPANCATTTAGSGIIPAGATDESNSIAAFSSNGPELAANGVVAPGVKIFTTDINNGYTGGANGTSFSAPHVAGVAALLLSARTGACNSAACAQDVQAKLRAGADGIGVSAAGASGVGPLGNASGAGRINAFKSVRLMVRGTLAGFDGQEKVIAFPNPFKVSENGAVAFAIPPSLQGAGAKIKIYTVAGELVKELNGLAWDGRNTSGNKVASGTYIYQVKTSAGEKTGRFAVIR